MEGVLGLGGQEGVAPDHVAELGLGAGHHGDGEAETLGDRLLDDARDPGGDRIGRGEDYVAALDVGANVSAAVRRRRSRRRSAIGSLFLPPTLMPRRSARWVAIRWCRLGSAVSCPAGQGAQALARTADPVAGRCERRQRSTTWKRAALAYAGDGWMVTCGASRATRRAERRSARRGRRAPAPPPGNAGGARRDRARW